MGSVSLTLNNAPAKDALMFLARLGDTFVFVGDGAGADGNGENASGVPVSMAFRNERFDRSEQRSAGLRLQGKMDGRTLLVGTSVAAKTFGPQMSKVFRLNQVDVEGAAQYLASMGASMTYEDHSDHHWGSGYGGRHPDQQQRLSNHQPGHRDRDLRERHCPGGLSGVTNSRLNTVTLVEIPA